MPARHLTLAAITTLVLTPAAGQAEPSNFRLGTGLFSASIEHAPDWLTDGSQQGFSVFGEFPQSNYAASRFILYRINGADGVRMQGGETQLMWGWGLAQPGPRAYTGPAWHYDKMLVQRSDGDHYRVFNGWGWQIGMGFQFRAVTLDVAATWRDADDYNSEIKRTGHRDTNVWTRNLLLSYRF